MSWTPPYRLPDVTIDDIVARFLNYVHYDDEQDFTEILDAPDALELLKDEVDTAESDLAEAKYDKRSAHEIETLQKKLTKLRERYTTAYQIQNTAQHELANIRQEQPSRLQLSSTKNQSEIPRFTTCSVYEWLQSKFNIEVPEWAPHQRVDNDKSPETLIAGNELRNDARRNYELIIAALMELFVEAKNSTVVSEAYGKPGQPQKSAIANAVVDELKRHKKAGLSASTLQNRLGNYERLLKSSDTDL